MQLPTMNSQKEKKIHVRGLPSHSPNFKEGPSILPETESPAVAQQDHMGDGWGIMVRGTEWGRGEGVEQNTLQSLLPGSCTRKGD